MNITLYVAICGIVAVMLFLYIRNILKSRLNLEMMYREVLTSDKYKVKGKYE